MAEKKTIELEIKSNVDESIAGLKALKRQLKDTAAGSEEFKKIYNQIDDLEDKIKSSKNASSDWIDSLEMAGGPLGALGGSLNRAKVATQSFGGALKATGIGLIVALIGGLVAAFSDNEVAMKKLQPLLDGMKKIFQGIFRAVEPLFNTLVDLAVSALPMVSEAFGVVYSSVTAVFDSLGMIGSAIKKLISGDFSGAWEDAKSSVTDFSKNYDASVKRFNSGTKEMTATEKEESEKRAAARKEAQEKQNAINEKAKQERIRLAAEEKKRLEEIEKERQELIGRQGAKAREEYEAAEKIIADARKANEDALKTENQIKVEKEIADFELKKANLLSKNLSIEEIEAEHKRKLGQLDDEYFAKEADNNIKATADAKAAADAQNATEQAKFDLKLSLLNQTATAIGGLGALFKKGTAAAKAAALAEIAIGSAVGLINGLDIAQKSAKGTGPAAAFAFPLFFATQVAAVFGAVSRAKAILSSGGGSAPSTSSGGRTSPSANVSTAPPSFNVVGASSTNQLAQTIGQQQNQPIKAYVVANDVTTQQSLDRNIVNSATIG
jgi:hypothetical protein